MESQRHAAGIVVVIALVVGCAGPSWRWDRACASVEDSQSDRNACIEESGDTSGIMHLTTRRFVDRCMVERGWQKTPVDERPVCESDRVLEQPVTPAGLSFDDCFSRCRELTDRSTEECFDVCLEAAD